MWFWCQVIVTSMNGLCGQWAVSVLYKVKVALAASTRHHHHQIQQTNKSKDDEAEKSLFSLIKD
jgi:hypothetical protein